MKYKKEDKFIKFLQNHLSNLIDVAKVSNFDVDIIPAELDNKDFKGPSPSKMTSVTDYEYLYCTIRYNKHLLSKSFKNKCYQYIIGLLCHEVTHIITGEAFDINKIKYSGDGKYYQERLTEHVSRFIYKIYIENYMTIHHINIKTGLKMK